MGRWQQVTDDVLAVPARIDTEPRGFRIRVDAAISQGEDDVSALAATSFPDEKTRCVPEFLAELLEAVSERLKSDPANKAFLEAQKLLKTPGIRVPADQRPT